MIGAIYTFYDNHNWQEMLDLSISTLDIPYYVVRCNSKKECQEARLHLPEITPFEDTLFLDADTIVLGGLKECSHLFHSDLMMQSWWNVSDLFRLPDVWRPLLTFYPQYESFPWWNGGTIFFRKTQETKDFFKDWYSEWSTYSDKTPRPMEPALMNLMARRSYTIDKLHYSMNIPIFDALRPNSLPITTWKILHAAGIPIENRVDVMRQALKKFNEIQAC